MFRIIILQIPYIIPCQLSSGEREFNISSKIIFFWLIMSCGKATLMQDVAQLSTLSRGIEAPSLSSCSAEKNPYINFKGVKQVFGIK